MTRKFSRVGWLCGVALFGALLASPGMVVAQPSADGAPAGVKLDWYQPEFWQSIDGAPVQESWEFDGNEVRLIKPRGGRGSLISRPVPEHFELSFQWKIGPKANNGIKYRIRKFGNRWLGLEYQMLDEPIPLSAPSKGSTASIYELVAPTLDKPLNPAGEWNDARIVAVGDKVEHYLNGRLVASAVTSGPGWAATVARSKFYGNQAFGESRPDDRIMLTDHGGLAAYRNFQLVEFPAPQAKPAPPPKAPQLANALRNSWADQTSIVLWTRTTRNAEMVTDGPEFVAVSREEQRALAQSDDAEHILRAQLPAGAELEQMQGACPGAPGEVRLTYFPATRRNQPVTTDWSVTRAEDDFTHQWSLEGLQPGTEYMAIVEARRPGETELTAVVRGSFRTAPPADEPAKLTFCMTTCHDFIRRDDGPNGHKIYPAMRAIGPDFVVHAGDIEYYDHPFPWAMTIDLMRFKWGRIFALPNNREFYANHTTYFLKDDHDTLKDDCWPGQRYGAVTFEQGVRLFNLEQFPTRTPRYATVRWGRDVQIWLLEGRDFRNSNTMPDGPDKTILGAEQKAWLAKTLEDSTATFKLVFSPTPVVGPDRPSKRDNHANEVFAHEGNELRELFGRVGNVIVFCGDRHWQYASVDSATQLWEFGCGPGSEAHPLGWRKEWESPPEQRYLRLDAGFLTGTLTPKAGEGKPAVLTIRHHSVTGKEVSRFQFPNSVGK